MLDAAADASVRHAVIVSSAMVYGAWETNPVPLTEDAPLRPSPGYLPAIVDGECERLLGQWAAAAPGRIATRLRIAPVVGAGARSLLSAIATGHAPVRVRGAAPPVQVVHADDVATALDLASAVDLDGAFNVAADGWLSYEEATALLPHRRAPALPADLARRVLRAGWETGLGDAPPAVLPYLEHPFVVANDRLKAAGWKPVYPNDEALLLATPPSTTLLPWLAGAGALGAGIALGTWWLTRRRRRRRR
jgi:nucleoside-diphosphate-sugar epimerase